VGSLALAPPIAKRAMWKRLGGATAVYIQGVMLAGLSGTIDVNGQEYVGLIMPPQDRLTDEQLASIANYVLHALNGIVGHSISTASVARVRAAPPNHQTLREMRDQLGK
jgi:mono/diheme cytochrome c family protein